MRDFYRQTGGGKRKLCEAKEWVGYYEVTLLGGLGGLFGSGLAGADQAIPDRLV